MTLRWNEFFQHILPKGTLWVSSSQRAFYQYPKGHWIKSCSGHLMLQVETLNKTWWIDAPFKGSQWLVCLATQKQVLWGFWKGFNLLRVWKVSQTGSNGIKFFFTEIFFLTLTISLIFIDSLSAKIILWVM